MSNFFKYKRQDGTVTESVFINVSQVSVATYNEATENLSIQMQQGHRETLIGDQATKFLAVLDAMAAE